ncbi:MAG: protein nirF [Deltaproteobacteria bacterium]|nr:protein nirF [Deltaproteobacteria bacterium]
MKKTIGLVLLLSVVLACTGAIAKEQRLYGTSALMAIVERESGSVAVIDSISHELIGKVEGLGDLKHASIVFSRDARFAYVIGRDGTLSKVDLLSLTLAAQAKAGAHSIGIAISRDNRYLMVCNYSPGGVVIFDSKDLKAIKEIPALLKDGKTLSRTVGPLDTPDNLMIFGLMEGNSVWVVDMKKEGFPVIRKFENVGDTPYDQLITPDGRYYLVGLQKSGWMGLLDTWRLDKMQRIDVRQRRIGVGEKEEVPIYHIPHLESWAITSGLAFVPAFGEKRVIVYSLKDWSIVKSIPISGTGLFVVARPGGREVWVDNVGAPGSKEERLVEIIDVDGLYVKKTIDVGTGAIDPQFTPKGEAVYISVRDENKVAVYDTDSCKLIKEIPLNKPSGIFSSDRASKFGL